MDSKEYLNYYYLGLSYLKIDLNKQALDAFKKCVLINTNFGLSHYELGKIYTSILNEDLAIKHFEFANKNLSFDDLNYRLGHIYYNNSFMHYYYSLCFLYCRTEICFHSKIHVFCFR